MSDADERPAEEVLRAMAEILSDVDDAIDEMDDASGSANSSSGDSDWSSSSHPSSSSGAETDDSSTSTSSRDSLRNYIREGPPPSPAVSAAGEGVSSETARGNDVEESRRGRKRAWRFGRKKRARTAKRKQARADLLAYRDRVREMMGVVEEWVAVVLSMEADGVDDATKRRTRRDVSNNTFQHCQSLLERMTDRQYFEQFRMSRTALNEFIDTLQPQFLRPEEQAHKRGPKTTSHFVLVLYTLIVITSGVSTWNSTSLLLAVGRSTLRDDWVMQVCAAVTATHPIEPLPLPTDAQAWAQIAGSFVTLAQHNVYRDSRTGQPRWRRHLPTARTLRFLGNIGVVIDGMHTKLRFKPSHLGDDCQRYFSVPKGCYAFLHLLGVDGTGKIIFAVFGHPIADGDQAILNSTALGKGMKGDSNFFDCCLPEGFIVVGDSGFTLRTWLMTPFKKIDFVGIGRALGKRRRAFNLRLSQLRVCSENAFGRLKGRFQILRDLPYGPERATAVVQCCACIHNWLNDRREDEVSDDIWRELAEAGELEDWEEAVESQVQSASGVLNLTCLQEGKLARDRQVNFLHGLPN